MNILPHKSFHVYNNDNVARVRRDEAEAEEKEHQRQQQVIDADRAARLEKLRSRRRGTATESGNANAELATVLSNAAPQPEPTKDLSLIQTPSGHFNFFKELEAGTKRDASGPSTSTNPSERTKSEPKRDPFTTYLDPGKKVRTPWYTQMAISDQTRAMEPDAESEKERRERRTRNFQDPIHAMGIRRPPPDPAPWSSPTRDSGATRPVHRQLALPPPRQPSPPGTDREQTRKRRRHRDDGSSEDDGEHGTSRSRRRRHRSPSPTSTRRSRSRERKKEASATSVKSKAALIARLREERMQRASDERMRRMEEAGVTGPLALEWSNTGRTSKGRTGRSRR